MYTIALSLWRTCVPYLVAFAGVQAARLGLHLDNATATSALTTGFGTVYYMVFRFLEHRFGARWGWALGAARPPSYPSALPRSGTEPGPGAGDQPTEPAVDYSSLPEGG
ncbi:hypothetical protein [Streptomyces sp. HPF1205]|uniref:hypothetical protein n=1 Tax=Streptomyces sp. HPF1205 TaxID=2873262 RepID=UPI001CEC1222|nr:hypothetical protein [Streptomyces sp. HPF1205]